MVDQVQHQTMEAGHLTYPARPGEPDCVYYLNHGLCGYGLQCRFNHPPLTGNLSAGKVGGQLPERTGQPDCQYYMKTGFCKFGAACKYYHPQRGLESPFQLNLSGLPMRLPGEHCSTAVSIPSSPVYAMSTYSSLNSFHGITPNYVRASGSYLPGLEIPAPASYFPIVLPPHWGFKGSQSPKTPLDGMEQSPTAANSKPTWKTGFNRFIKSRASAVSCEEGFPEREGEPECQYYLKTGDCRFGAFCKFHHPKGRTAFVRPPKYALNVIGLPLRPGEPYCSYYTRYGICKFGPVCKFDHPILVPLYNAMGVAPAFNMTMQGTSCGSSGENVSITSIKSCGEVGVDGGHCEFGSSREEDDNAVHDANIIVSAQEESDECRLVEVPS